MKKRLRLIGAFALGGALSFLASALWADNSSLAERREHLRQYTRERSGDAEAGGKVFQGRLGCVSCHGHPGEGGDIGPDLRGVGQRHDREGLIKKVLDPRPGVAMPGNFAEVLSEEEFADLIAWLERQ
jgi:mono/diheme cytochrome c family protein